MTALHTRFSRGLAMLALGVGALGLALGNPVFLLLAATLACVLHAARAGWPGEGSVAFTVAAPRVARGSAVEATLAARAEKGPALFWAHVGLPPSMTLEEGSNVALLSAGQASREAVRIGAPRRGEFHLGPATLTAVHPHLLAPPTEVARAPAVELVVEPRLHPLRRAKPLRARARVGIGSDLANRGPSGSEFRELRAYQRGDPLKAVNWKATAKRSRDDLELMVNAFEPEARKDVWFFLDLGERMEVGTTLDNALEDAIEATLALAHHFATRGHRVGGTTFHAPALTFAPEAGSRQYLSIARALARARPGAGEEGLEAAAERVRAFLARGPTVFVVTRPELDPEGVAAGVRRIRGYASGRHPRPVYVLAPRPRHAQGPEALALALQAREGRALLGPGAAVRVLALPEGARSLDLALARGVLAR